MNTATWFLLAGTLFAFAAIILASLFLAGVQQPPAPPPQIITVPVPQPTPLQAPVAKLPPPVPIRLLSGGGRLLGQTTLPAGRRRGPVLQQRVTEGGVSLLCTFVAARQAEDGVWEYRRVGVERE